MHLHLCYHWKLCMCVSGWGGYATILVQLCCGLWLTLSEDLDPMGQL